MALRSELPLVSFSRSASSMMMTRKRPCDGDRCASSTRGRAVSARMKTPSVATTVTSGCSPRRVVVQSWHVPQPPVVHCSAAANARAALDRPEPGGPVSSHAWVIAAGSSIACRSTSTAGSWPTTSSQTLVMAGHPEDRGHPRPDLGGQLVDRPRRVEHEPAPRLAPPRVRGTPRGCAGGTRHQPAPAGRRVPRRRRLARDRVEVEQHRQRREQTVDGPQREAFDLVGPQVPAAALVGHRRVEVPVGHAPPRRGPAPGGPARPRGAHGRWRRAAPRCGRRRGRRAAPRRAAAGRARSRRARASGRPRGRARSATRPADGPASTCRRRRHPRTRGTGQGASSRASG